MLNYRESIILAILMAGEKYGREIRNLYERETKEGMPIGSLYTTLARMEDKGFVASRFGESKHWRGGNRRKYFRITASGSGAYDAAALQAAAVLGGRKHGAR